MKDGPKDYDGSPKSQRWETMGTAEEPELNTAPLIYSPGGKSLQKETSVAPSEPDKNH
jgi:hypothetical protein